MSEELSIRDLRLQKLARMRELGHDPYAIERFERTDTAKNLLDKFEEGKPVSFAGRVVSYRLMGKAGFAHISDGDAKIQGYFRKDDLEGAGWELYNLLDIGDHVGVRGFLFTTKTGEKSIHVQELAPLSKALHAIPIGKEKDGKVFYGLSDVDLRYRHRHLDLIANAESRKALIDRARIVSAVRRYFDSNGYLEVETPLLQLEAGGAAARPFTTHYNAYDIDVKLRISLELYLKRLICGDIPAVYEIGRVFRNEGLSSRHNPEFTLLEFYEAYGNLETMMSRVEEVFRAVATEVFGTTVLDASGVLSKWKRFDGPFASDLIVVEPFIIKPQPFRVDKPSEFEGTRLKVGDALRAGQSDNYLVVISPNATLYEESSEASVKLIECDSVIRLSTQDGEWFELPPGIYTVLCPSTMVDTSEVAHQERMEELAKARVIDFAKPWRRLDLITAICDRTGIQPDELAQFDSAKAAMRTLGLSTQSERDLGGIIEKLLEVFVEPTLQEPTFVVGYPIETSPLAKKDPNNPRMTRRFEGYVLGREICNAFSEINDPIDQRERFEQQLGERAKGDDEAHPMDEDFVYALESGMPPTGGCGIGLDRMAMLLTGSDHIREVLFFPFMRPEGE